MMIDYSGQRGEGGMGVPGGRIPKDEGLVEGDHHRQLQQLYSRNGASSAPLPGYYGKGSAYEPQAGMMPLPYQPHPALRNGGLHGGMVDAQGLSAPMPRTVSITTLALEEAVGSSLACAINSLDINGQQQKAAAAAQAQLAAVAAAAEAAQAQIQGDDGGGFLPHAATAGIAQQQQQQQHGFYPPGAAHLPLQHHNSFPSSWDHRQWPEGLPRSAPPHPQYPRPPPAQHYARRSSSDGAHGGGPSAAPAPRAGSGGGGGGAVGDSWAAVLNSAAGPELMPFLTERESHALVLWNVGRLSAADLRAACEAHGALYYLRDEYRSLNPGGVVFLAYLDLRCAARAHAGLPHELRHRWGAPAAAAAHFSIPLHAATAAREGAIVVRGLPPGAREADVAQVCQAAGGDVRAVRRLQLEAEEGEGEGGGGGGGGEAAVVEFFDIGDAQHALQQLAAHPPPAWGRGFAAEAARRSEGERALGRQLLATLERWRSQAAQSGYSHGGGGGSSSAQASRDVRQLSRASSHHGCSSSGSSDDGDGAGGAGGVPPPNRVPSRGPRGDPSDASALTTPETTPGSTPPSGLDLCGGAEGGYVGYEAQMYGVHPHVLHLPPHPPPPGARHARHHSLDHIHMPPYVGSPMGGATPPGYPPLRPFMDPYEDPYAPPCGGIYSSAQAQYRRMLERGGGYHSAVGPSAEAAAMLAAAHHARQAQHEMDLIRDGRRENRTWSSAGVPPGMGGPSEAEFALDIGKIAKGLDKRTTIMIRNIPNKYTQAMLLQEINVNFLEAFDFFYLPIDFKNRCNVGYAFINFIDFRRIIAFTREFHGQRWRNFNSEKVCAISYARIQGKASMICRFQNSSLMEKDGEYRPLLFYSSGPDRGRPEPFPLGTKQRRIVTPPLAPASCVRDARCMSSLN